MGDQTADREGTAVRIKVDPFAHKSREGYNSSTSIPNGGVRERVGIPLFSL